VVVAKDVAARGRLQMRLERELAENVPSAVTRVYPLGLGPPVGWPVQYRVSGPDVNQVRDIALRLASVMASNPAAAGRQFRLDGTGPEGPTRYPFVLSRETGFAAIAVCRSAC
jgi:multidrug efflux pump